MACDERNHSQHQFEFPEHRTAVLGTHPPDFPMFMGHIVVGFWVGFPDFGIRMFEFRFWPVIF